MSSRKHSSIVVLKGSGGWAKMVVYDQDSKLRSSKSSSVPILSPPKTSSSKSNLITKTNKRISSTSTSKLPLISLKTSTTSKVVKLRKECCLQAEAREDQNINSNKDLNGDITCADIKQARNVQPSDIPPNQENHLSVVNDATNESDKATSAVESGDSVNKMDKTPLDRPPSSISRYPKKEPMPYLDNNLLCKTYPFAKKKNTIMRQCPDCQMLYNISHSCS